MTLINKETLQTELEHAEKQAFTENMKYGIGIARQIVEQAPEVPLPQPVQLDAQEVAKRVIAECERKAGDG